MDIAMLARFSSHGTLEQCQAETHRILHVSVKIVDWCTFANAVLSPLYRIFVI